MTDARATSAHHLQTLARWAAGTQVADLPPAVLRKAAGVLADDLAAMVGARDEPEVQRFHQRLLARAHVPEATVWRGGTARTDRLSAAVANALAGDWLELDEGYRPTPCHAGLYLLPALLAEAEATGLRCDALLRALVLGYEIITRVARAWTPRTLTMQAHGRYAAVGAAAGISLARRLAPDELVAALGAAATLIGPAPRNHLEEGVLIRNAWPASGAWNGMMAVEWAGCGIGGSAQALHDVYGTVLDGEAHPQRLVDGLGAHWAVLDGYTKIYACCQHLHSTVEAAMALRAGHGALALPEQIAGVAVQCHPLALAFANAAPATTLGAKFSLPHAVAAALVLGDAGAPAFAARTLADPAIAALRERVGMEAWPGPLAPPNDRPARVTVTLHDGRAFSAECLSARGGPDRPLPDDTWIGKMRVLAEPAYPAIVGVFQEIVRGDARRLAQPWPETVRDITAGALTPL